MANFIFIGAGNLLGINDAIASSPIDIKVYPNPSTGKINIETLEMIKVEVMDMQGRIVLSSSEIQIDLSDKSKGIYFIRVTTNNGVGVKKVVLQ